MQQFGDPLRQSFMRALGGRQRDQHRQFATGPAGRGMAGGGQQPVAQLMLDAQFPGDRPQPGGRDQAQLGMLPVQQGFGAERLALASAGQRAQAQHQFVAAGRASQAGREQTALEWLLVAARVVASRFAGLCGVECGAGMVEQHLQVAAMLAQAGPACTRSELPFSIAQCVRLIEQGRQGGQRLVAAGQQ